MKKSLFGYGGTTKAIAKSGGWDIFDDRFSEKSEDEFGNILLNPSEFKPEFSELEIPSPGFPCEHKIVKSARNLISEYDYFLNPLKPHPKTLWISGTNGKTTTTKMSEFLLKNLGVQMGGNVGIPLANLNSHSRMWILETSSFTLHYTKFASPEIYVLLPITPDHLSWHGNMQNYEAAKLKPLSMMKEGSVAILPSVYANLKSLAKIIGYENEEDLAEKFGLDIGKIVFKTPFLLDALLALAVQQIISGKVSYDTLNSFVIENNKLEEFHDKFGRIWVNDTKATNIDAAIQAIRRYKNKPLHLILGGDDKGVDLRPVFTELSGITAQIYAMGSSATRIMDLASEFKINAIKCDILEVAVTQIAKDLQKDEIALLSPACASLDQFKSYAERGDKFKEFVANLK